ncbi:MAG: hypothetical protein LQ343_006381 [Gyalolechia ehrenbergii]|nr:MAG: hypothetical protein LQ343_006381 [Gyalolechia ehrenbergii]
MSKRVRDPELQHQLSSIPSEKLGDQLTENSSFTESKASSYGLTGWVRNNANNQVEGEAQGDDEAIQKLLKALESGPPAASVTKVDKSEIDVKEGESSFTAK